MTTTGRKAERGAVRGDGRRAARPRLRLGGADDQRRGLRGIGLGELDKQVNGRPVAPVSGDPFAGCWAR